MTERPDSQAEQLALLLEQARADLRAGRTLTQPSKLTDPELAAAYRRLLESLVAQGEAEGSRSPASGQPSPDSTAPEGLPHLGRYLLLGPLGAGGMATVYKALDPALKRFVAVKVPQFSGSPASLEQQHRRFLREAQAASQLRHPNVCPVHDLGEEKGTPYLVMEWVDGESLQKRLEQRGPLKDACEAVTLVCQALRGLEALHETCGLVHRDLKPANILLDAHGTPLLSDFGLARPLRDAEYLTAPGTLLGTVPYMAPEQVAGSPDEAIGPHTDIYSLGVVLYQVLTGRLPFEMPFPNILWHIQQGPVPPVQSHRPDLDPSLAELIHKAMARAPAERFPSAAAMRAALEGWLQAQAAPTLPDAAAAATEVLPPEPSRRSRLLRAGLLLVLAGLLAGGVWLVLRPRDQQPDSTLSTPLPFISEKEVLTAIRDDLRERSAEKRKFRRYFSLVHLANDPARGSPEQLRLTRAALARLLNSLSGKKGLAALGPCEVVLAVDLRALGWEIADAWGEPILWQEVLKTYPYGLHHRSHAELGALAREVHELCGQDLAYVRADWFIAAASRPPLYGRLLRQGGKHERNLRDESEPIAAVVRAYQADLTLEQAALELGLPDPALLRDKIRSEKRLRDAGLGPLAAGQPLPRRVWAELDERLFSPFQECAQALDCGQPHRVR
jgi:serine/threonine-protein kinase